MTDDGSFSVSFASGQKYDINEVRQRGEAFMPDGEHAWVVGVIYGIDDPDESMEGMSLGPDNFVGVTQIHCLLCMATYKPERRYHKCSQQPASDPAGESTEAATS